MRIFLTFASEQRDIAESILLALRNRGHEVFFSHDDLPPADSFDLRIQKAIATSELLVFLISPESVAKGRYTLTELVFARDRWRSPRGRVLPVVVAPTPMVSMPNYLKAVTLLEPEGNIAAETAAAVDRLNERSRSRSMLVFALLGIVTGGLSYLAFRYPLPFLHFSFLLQSSQYGPDPTTVLPGMIFGALITACIYQYGIRERFLLFVPFVFTVLAWILAYDSTVLVFGALDQFKKTVQISDDARPGSSEITETARDTATSDSEQTNSNATAELRQQVQTIPYGGAMSGIVGGFVGGFVTVFGVSIATPRFRRPEPWMTTISIATVLGMLLEASRLGDVIGGLALFTIWQAAVIAFVDRGMALGGEGPGL
jgi:hypothetical protein